MRSRGCAGGDRILRRRIRAHANGAKETPTSDVFLRALTSVDCQWVRWVGAGFATCADDDHFATVCRKDPKRESQTISPANSMMSAAVEETSPTPEKGKVTPP